MTTPDVKPHVYQRLSGTNYCAISGCSLPQFASVHIDKISERERIAKIILRHRYFSANSPAYCLCSPDVPRTMEEHALHVADRIQRRREN